MPTWEDTEIASLDQAKQHLRLGTSTDEDDDLALKLRHAHALVLDYVADGKDDDEVEVMEAWDDETAPAAVQAAILRQFGDLVRFRGDDADDKGADGNFLSPRVKQLLLLYRKPALA